MKNPATNTPPPEWSGYLSDLASLPLEGEYQHVLDVALRGNAGTPVWKARKESELRDLCALAQVSGRIHIKMADLTVALRVVFEMHPVPVPTLPDPDGELVVHDRALLGLTYPEEALATALPGFAFMMLLLPRGLWLPNAGPPPGPETTHLDPQAICLAPTIPAGTPAQELILRTYSALTMQSVQLDPEAAEGVLNPRASAWWQANPSLYPLSREGFLEPHTAPRS